MAQSVWHGSFSEPQISPSPRECCAACLADTRDAILATREMLQIGIVTFFMMLAHWSLRETNIETAVTRLPRWIVTTAWALMACAIILTQGSSNAFIYFQF
jgi:hypothetical protein